MIGPVAPLYGDSQQEERRRACPAPMQGGLAPAAEPGKPKEVVGQIDQADLIVSHRMV